jgi:RNA polymerase sigma-70 factor (ECF subfamily)
LHTDVIKHIKQGDKKAFKSVFDNYFNALCAFGYRYISDLSAVEDMAQEVFISFWENRNDFDHINAVKAFLYTSVRNKCLNHIKHQAVLKKHENALTYELHSEQFFTNHIIEEETFNQLYIEIRNLPKAAQQIMLLALNGLKNQEIADELNISVNTVKTQKKISYATLKDKIGPILNVILLNLLFW